MSGSVTGDADDHGKRSTMRLAAASDWLDTWARTSLFLAIFAFFWISTDPFISLGEHITLDASVKSSAINQIVAVLLTCACLGYIAWRGAPLLTALPSTAFCVLSALMLLSCVFSPNADVALRRFLLALMIQLMTALFLVLPRSPKHFVGLLAVGAYVVLALCYFGVAFMPTRSIHLISDPTEPNLAGNWRGVFPHKNSAGVALAAHSGDDDHAFRCMATT